VYTVCDMYVLWLKATQYSLRYMQLCASEKEDKSNEVSAGENVKRLCEWEKFKSEVSEEASKSERIKVRKKERKCRKGSLFRPIYGRKILKRKKKERKIENLMSLILNTKFMSS
jgi:hypothetical protein